MKKYPKTAKILYYVNWLVVVVIGLGVGNWWVIRG